MKERTIALIGFRATGKSAVGRLLAEGLGRLFIDMDQYLTASAGREIACWVRLEGWASFRKAESELLSTLSSREGLVVATGGGIVLDPENRRLLKERYHTVWLVAGLETVHDRLLSDPQTCATRPPLSDLPLKEEISKLLSDREPLYKDAADFKVDTEGKSIAEIACCLIEHFSHLKQESPGQP